MFNQQYVEASRDRLEDLDALLMMARSENIDTENLHILAVDPTRRIYQIGELTPSVEENQLCTIEMVCHVGRTSDGYLQPFYRSHHRSEPHPSLSLREAAEMEYQCHPEGYEPLLEEYKKGYLRL